MIYRLPPLQALRAFESASRHLSFKKAAEELHVTPAAVSQQIKLLETYLDVELFRRLTRALELTPQAEAMLPKIREGFACLARAVDAAHQPAVSVLSVAAPPSFATRWLVPRLPHFRAACPDVRVRLASSPDAVDRRGETPLQNEEEVDPREAESRVAIRFGTGHYPGYRVESLFESDWVPVCSPALLADKPLQRPADLAAHVLIHDETIEEGERHPGWQEWLKLAGVSGIDASRGPRFSNAVLAVEAALDGQGVALALLPLVAADIAAGRLVTPFVQTVPSPYAYYLVVPEALVDRPAIVAFRDWLLQEIAIDLANAPMAG